MDGLREIHFGERSLSLSHLYKKDSRRCIPLPVVFVVDLFAELILPAPCCCWAWFWVDAEETLWWELTTPRGEDDDEPSTSKLEEIQEKKIFRSVRSDFSSTEVHHSFMVLSHNHCVIADAHHSTAIWASLHTLINSWIFCLFGLANASIWLDACWRASIATT